MAATQERESVAFMQALWDGKPDGALIQVWAKADKSSHYIDNVEVAAKRAVDFGRDAYVGVSLVAKNLGKRRRGTAKESAGIAGLWADIDVNGGPEDKRGAAPTFEVALELATCVLAPTLLIHSGHGLQGWWLFEEPWIFGTLAERERAAELSAGWIARLQIEAKERGFKIDATQDLARLMRIPGTLNGKGGLDVPVVGYEEPIESQDGARYAIEVLSEHVESVPASAIFLAQSADVDIAFSDTANPPFDKLEAMLENSELFSKTWRRARAEKKWSPSEYDLSLASQAAAAAWTDQEITDLMIAHRRKHGDDLKRADYYARTVRKVRSEAKEEEREQVREEALDQLVEIGQSDDGADADKVTNLFTQAIGGRFQVREVIQSNRDPDNAIFRLILANGDEIPIGKFENLDDPNKFARRFAVATGFRPPSVSRQKWINAVNGLLKARVVREAEVTTKKNQVLGWLKLYVDAMLVPDHNEAAVRRDPFEKDGFIWIAPRSFHDYVSRQLRKRMEVSDLEEVLDRLGFEKRLKNYVDADRKIRTTTTDYYKAPLTLLDEAEPEPEPGDDGAAVPQDGDGA